MLDRFAKLGISVEKHGHAPVPTVEAMADEMSKLGVQGICTKNLFLKDKKNRLYIITSAPDTKVDIKVLSARLGMGKGGLRFAPEELLEPVLGLAPGSVTPLAVVQPSAAAVVLLIDQKLQGQARLLVHPLANDATLALSSEGLAKLLGDIGRSANYVDLEADPKIDRDNPPDLAKYIQETAGVSAEELAAKAQVDASLLAGPATTAAGAAAGGAKTGKKAAAGNAKRQAGDGSAMDVETLATVLMEQVSKASGGSGGAGQEEQRRLQADIVMRLNGLRNAAFAAGFSAGKGTVMSMIDGSYA